MANAILEVQDLSMHFGGLKAVEALSLSIPEGVLYGLIGPNGAGKTTVFNMLTGVYLPTRGNILFSGKSLIGLKPHQISQMGLARTFQNIRLFKGLSVLDNAIIPAFQHTKTQIIDVFFQTDKFRREELEVREKASDLLNMFGLGSVLGELASALPYGNQRKLEIVRALMSQPKMILLDEPAAGMNNAETEQLMHLIDQIRKSFAVTILLIEHDMKLVMGICEKIYVLDYGLKIEEGSAQKIRSSPQVIQAYLGIDEEGANDKN